MVRQFTAKSKNTEKTKKDQYKGYVGEPLEKFKKRMTKDGADLGLYEITNDDVDIEPEGYIIIAKIMDLVEKLKGSVSNTKRIVQITDGLGLLRKEGEETDKKQDKEDDTGTPAPPASAPPAPPEVPGE